MRYYEATSTIAAGPEAVWAVLSDGGDWPTWDSGVVGVEGRMAPGEKITIRTEVAPGRAFPVTVTTFEPPRRLVFTGGMPLGLFRGVRTFTLTPDPGRHHLCVREEYTGLMLGLLWRSMPDLGPSFEKFAHGLKQHVESGSAP